MSRLVITGESHASVLAIALRLTPAEQRAPFDSAGAGRICNFAKFMVPFHQVKDGRLAFVDPDVAQAFEGVNGAREFLPDTRYALCMGYTTTLVLRSSMWKAFNLLSDPPNPRKAPLSEGVVKAIFRAHMRHVLQFFEDATTAGLHVLAVAAPYPQADDPKATLQLSPRSLSQIDRLGREAIEEDLIRIGVKTVHPPEETTVVSEDGRFTAPAFRSNRETDFHHANPHYGKLMVRKIIDQAAEMGGRAPRRRAKTSRSAKSSAQ